MGIIGQQHEYPISYLEFSLGGPCVIMLLLSLLAMFHVLLYYPLGLLQSLLEVSHSLGLNCALSPCFPSFTYYIQQSLWVMAVDQLEWGGTLWRPGGSP